MIAQSSILRFIGVAVVSIAFSFLAKLYMDNWQTENLNILNLLFSISIPAVCSVSCFYGCLWSYNKAEIRIQKILVFIMWGFLYIFFWPVVVIFVFIFMIVIGFIVSLFETSILHQGGNGVSTTPFENGGFEKMVEWFVVNWIFFGLMVLGCIVINSLKNPAWRSGRREQQE